MTNIKLILLDLDGTLLNDKMNVPKGFDKLVEELKKRNIRIGVATGRSYDSIKFLFPNSYKQMVVVTCNGSSIYVDDKNIYRSYLKTETVKKAIDIARKENNISIQLLKEDEIFCVQHDPFIELFNECGYHAKGVDDLKQHCDNLVMATSHSKINPLELENKYKTLKEEVKVIISSSDSVDFINLDVSKGAATKIVCDYLNIQNENVMAIGNEDNDLELLNSVGYPVAMLNANNNVKKIAKDITYKTNSQDGVIDYLTKKFIKEN